MNNSEQFRPKKDTSILPSIPLEVIRQLPQSELEVLAQNAGLPYEKFIAMIDRSSRAAQGHTDALKSKDINYAGSTKFLRPVSESERTETAILQQQSDAWIHDLYYTEKNLTKEAREKLYQQALEALTKVFAVERHEKVHALFMSGTPLIEALQIVSGEFEERALRSSNTPAIRDALKRNLFEQSSLQQFGEGTIFNTAGVAGGYTSVSGPTGSALKFNVDQPLNFPHGGRPRRSNDELEPY
jgi:hypothetical protein